MDVEESNTIVKLVSTAAVEEDAYYSVECCRERRMRAGVIARLESDRAVTQSFVFATTA